MLPTKTEINGYDSLDEQVAERHFLGKTLAEAEAMFRENSHTYQEDLLYMGPRAFAFYLAAAVNYVESEASAEDDEIVSMLLYIIENQKGPDFDILSPDISRLTRHVIENYPKFAVNEDTRGAIYGQYKDLEGDLKKERQMRLLFFI